MTGIASTRWMTAACSGWCRAAPARAWTSSTSNHYPLLSRDALEHRLTGYLAIARSSCLSLRGKHVTIHTLRHTCAMRLLESGTDVTVIALWLGHEKLATVQIYLHADMAQKERAIARVTPPGTRPGRYIPTDPLLTFLEQL